MLIIRKPFKGTYRRMPAPFHNSYPHMKYCVDFKMPVGTPLCAVEAGKVTYTESRFSKKHRNKRRLNDCNAVEIDHNTFQSLYAHFKWRGLTVKKGDKVYKGQVIGYSGQTGYATYPHLHFGIYDMDGNIIKVRFKS